jgi:hypothetical protein
VARVELLAEPFLNNLPAVTGGRIVLELVLRDVEATLGPSGREEAVRFARDERAIGNIQDEYPEELVSSLQTYIHDSFIDTAWPACPRQRNHPLWFGREDSWWCRHDNERVAALGDLHAVGRAG